MRLFLATTSQRPAHLLTSSSTFLFFDYSSFRNFVQSRKSCTCTSWRSLAKVSRKSSEERPAASACKCARLDADKTSGRARAFAGPAGQASRVGFTRGHRRVHSGPLLRRLGRVERRRPRPAKVGATSDELSSEARAALRSNSEGSSSNQRPTSLHRGWLCLT